MCDTTEVKQSIIVYIDYADFIIKYPLKNKKGNIYYTENNYIVKEYKEDPCLSYLCIELNAHSVNNHPCILKPLAWCVHENKAYLAMDKGEDIMDAYIAGKITIEEIISDTLAAIEYMHNNNMVHADIKPYNMVLHEGKCKMIDLGLSRPILLNLIDEEKYMKEAAYTDGYRDPEYYGEQYNNIKCEIHALVASYYGIIKNLNLHFGQIYTMSSDMPHIQWLLKKAQLLRVDRPTLTQLLEEAPKELIVRKYNNKANNTNCKKVFTLCHIICIVTNWIIGVASSFNIPVQLLFLTLSVANRSQSVLLKYKVNAKSLQLFGSAVLSVTSSAMFISSPSISTFEDLLEEDTKDPEYSNKFCKMATDILRECKGIVFAETYWDYACSSEDLLPLLYDFCHSRPPSKCYSGGSKNINMEKLHGEVQTSVILPINLPEYSNEERKWTDVTFRRSGKQVKDNQIKGCFIQSTNVVEVELLWMTNKEIQNSHFEVLIHNKNKLHKLKLQLALNICNVLLLYARQNFDIAAITLNIILHYDWRKLLAKILEKGLHPFSISKEELPI